jgi:fibrillarin-like rRNA methylase
MDEFILKDIAIESDNQVILYCALNGHPKNYNAKIVTDGTIFGLSFSKELEIALLYQSPQVVQNILRTVRESYEKNQQLQAA